MFSTQQKIEFLQKICVCLLKADPNNIDLARFCSSHSKYFWLKLKNHTLRLFKQHLVENIFYQEFDKEIKKSIMVCSSVHHQCIKCTILWISNFHSALSPVFLAEWAWWNGSLVWNEILFLVFLRYFCIWHSASATQCLRHRHHDHTFQSCHVITLIFIIIVIIVTMIINLLNQ